MSYQRVLAALVIFGSMAVYAESPVEKPALEKAKTAAEKVIGKLAEKVVINKESADKDEKLAEDSEDDKKKSADGSDEKSSKKSLYNKVELDRSSIKRLRGWRIKNYKLLFFLMKNAKRSKE